MTRAILLWGTALFLLAQLVVIGSVIVEGERVLSRGVECRFRVRGYDPHDPLRGKYIRFTPEIEATEIEPALLPKDHSRWHSSRAWFELSETPEADGYTKILRCAASPSAKGLWIGPMETHFDYALGYDQKGKDEKWEDFETRRQASGRIAKPVLPAKFYVPEKKAPEMEKAMRLPGVQPVAVYRVWHGKILLIDLQILQPDDK